MHVAPNGRIGAGLTFTPGRFGRPRDRREPNPIPAADRVLASAGPQEGLHFLHSSGSCPNPTTRETARVQQVKELLMRARLPAGLADAAKAHEGRRLRLRSSTRRVYVGGYFMFLQCSCMCCWHSTYARFRCTLQCHGIFRAHSVRKKHNLV